MLTIIHGDDIVQSRKYFLEIKNSKNGSVSFSSDFTLTDLVQSLEGGGLFSDETNVFIENVFSKRKQSRDLQKIFDFIQQKRDEGNIYLWEERKIQKGKLSKIQNATIKHFPLPQTIFQFLDSIAPGNKKSILYFHQVLETVEVDIILSMMIRLVRTLLNMVDVSEEIDEVKSMPPWQRQKLQKQQRFFTQKQLIKLHNDLFEADFRNKTGTLSSDLPTAIDLILINL